MQKVKRLLLIVLIMLLGAFGAFSLINELSHSISMPLPENPLYLDATQSIENRISDVVSHMTLAEKIGQMALVERNSLIVQEDIARYHLGGLLSGSGSKPADTSAAGWSEMIAGYQTYAQQSRLKIPLLYGTDAVHGHAHVDGMTVFPHQIGLGATRNPELVRAIAHATARDMVRTGTNWNYAPNLDQPRDIRWGRVYEAFSDDPELVTELGVAYIEGLQNASQNETSAIQVLATPKHYLGIGSQGWGSSLNKNFIIDQGVVPISETALREEYLPPYAAAVESGALSIMAGLHSWGDERVIRQKYLLTDILKDELQFSGFLVSDWYGVYEGKRSTFFATIEAINAGVDMVMLPHDYQTFVRNMTWAHRLGFISEERIDDAVGRIVRAKFRLGLLDIPPRQNFAAATIDLEHRALARMAVAESVVLLKNNNELLPLPTNIDHIRVAGSSADNVGRQLGGWSLEWQGVDGNWPENTTSIFKGIKNAVSPGTQVEYSLDGTFADTKKVAVGIAIVGEAPYAEGWGDTAAPALSAADLQAIKNLQAAAEQVVVVIVAGRPLFIEHERASFDGLLMAWLPGSAGEGVADVLFGTVPFTGRLPLPWPLRTEQLPITVTGATADGTDVLYPRYFGLSADSN